MRWICRIFGHEHAVLESNLTVKFVENCQCCGQLLPDKPYQGSIVLRCILFGHKHDIKAYQWNIKARQWGEWRFTDRKRCFACHSVLRISVL